jgi:hypothetical protein
MMRLATSQSFRPLPLPREGFLLNLLWREMLLQYAIDNSGGSGVRPTTNWLRLPRLQRRTHLSGLAPGSFTVTGTSNDPAKAQQDRWLGAARIKSGHPESR